jgi:hypothetical protein
MPTIQMRPTSADECGRPAQRSGGCCCDKTKVTIQIQLQVVGLWLQLEGYVRASCTRVFRELTGL